MADSETRVPPGSPYHLHLTLIGLDPPIWRRIAVPANATLNKLHRFIQIAFGWSDSHPHQFVTHAGTRLESKPRNRRDDPNPDVHDERGKRLPSYLTSDGETMRYHYNSGNWQVRVELVAILPVSDAARAPACLGGEFAAPPESSGTVEGYVDLLAVYSNPDHPDHDNLMDSLGDEFDPWVFNCEEVDKAIRSL